MTDQHLQHAQSEDTPPPYYPVFLDLRGKRCVVVGGGTVACRKVEGLLCARAQVTVIAPNVLPMPEEVTVFRRAFQPTDLDGALLVIAATDDPYVNEQVARAAAERHVLVNAVDDPERCDFILPSVVEREGLRIAISTGGASPTLARHLRKELERHYGAEYGLLVTLLWRLRQQWEPQMEAAHLTHPTRKQLWHDVLQLPLLPALRDGDSATAETLASALIAESIAVHSKR